MLCGPWPAYYMNVALGPCNERGRPEQCQLRGGTGLRCQKNVVAPSNASSGATELAYGKYWRRELPGLKPVRQWKIRQARARELAYGKYWRRELPGLKPVRQWKIGRARARDWRRELPGLEPIRQRKMRSKVLAPAAREVCYSSLPLAGRRVVQAAARGDTVELSRRRPVVMRGVPIVMAAPTHDNQS